MTSTTAHPAIDYPARVAKGIALLDEQIPDWADRLNEEILDISNGSLCVTAQLSGESDWVTGMEMLGLQVGPWCNGSYTLHGFNAESQYGLNLPEGYSQKEAFAVLNALWREAILARRTQTAHTDS